MPRKRALVVDDDIDWRRFVREAAEELRYKVIEAENAREAGYLLEEGQFDLLITDNWMEVADAGIDLLVRNKLLGRELPSILHTSHLSQSQRGRLRQELPDVIGVLKSPNPDFPELKAAIQKLIPE